MARSNHIGATEGEKSEEITSEPEALADILAWSEDRPLWQRDALRRLLESEHLSDDDITSLTALCKDQTRPATPLTADHIRMPVAGEPTVYLRAVRNALNINALAEEQCLSFLPNGVTIVYGDNGSGKSGYVRILKRVCRARGPDERILRNIYTASAGPQQAEIDFTVGGQDQTERWTNGEPCTPILSAVSVFDARTASIHVDETNDLAYTPFPIKLLERLVQTCRTLKTRLDAEIAALTAQTPHTLTAPDCSPDTAVGQLIASLSESTTKEEVETLATLSPQEVARLQTLATDLAQDPRATSLRIQAQKRRLDAQIVRFQALADAAADASVRQLLALWKDYQNKKDAAQLAARDLFTDEPLPEVGSETWRVLWEAARAYSAQAPYREQPFPFVGDGARCVLCQQELAPEAATRLQRFETFVQDRTKQDEIEAQRAVEEYEAVLVAATPRMSDLNEGVRFIRDELAQPALADLVRSFATISKWRLRNVLRTKAEPATPAPPSPAAALSAISEELGSRAAALLADDRSDERQALKRELQALIDRRWLAGVKEDVLAEIDRKKEIVKLETALRDTVHTQITNKSSALSEALVTDRLRGRFAQEIDRMRIAGLAVELRKTRTQHGVPQFRVSLIHKPQAKAGDILSEGEHRCVALAAFLAELSTTDSRSGIVFDDPISSLDHLHREVVAERLAEEGQHRQIIVLTHDLAFLFLLENACRERGTDVALRHVLRRSDAPGYCDNEPPLKAQSPARRVQSLQRHLDNARIQYERDPQGVWLITAKGLLGHIRDAWESAVEGAVAPVLRTFSRKVNTKGFSKLSAITARDAEEMRAGYGRCSILLHNASAALNPAIPTPDQIAEEIAALRAWIDNLQARQDQISAA